MKDFTPPNILYSFLFKYFLFNIFFIQIIYFSFFYYLSTITRDNMDKLFNFVEIFIIQAVVYRLFEFVISIDITHQIERFIDREVADQFVQVLYVFRQIADNRVQPVDRFRFQLDDFHCGHFLCFSFVGYCFPLKTEKQFNFFL